MRTESIIVVYESNPSLAEEIACRLGAMTMSVRELNHHNIKNSKSMILGIDLTSDGQLTPSWENAVQILRRENLEGKVFAEYVALGNEQDHDVEEISNILREQGARVISNVQYAVSPQWNIDSWTGMLSPSM